MVEKVIKKMPEKIPEKIPEKVLEKIPENVPEKAPTGSAQDGIDKSAQSGVANPDPEIVITSALPYANGPVHIGHLVEYIQTDIYVRALKLAGKRAIYCCASDTHGTPIQVNAEKAGVTPEEFIAKYHEEDQRDFAKYKISFDSYYLTNSEENRLLSEKIFRLLQKGDNIYEKEIEQLYDEEAKRFLPDRYVKGECPKCGAEEQYGDVCEKCHGTYKPTDLINPHSVITGARPVLRKSTHFFFKLSKFSGFLKEYLTKNSRLQLEIRNQILNWVESGLEDWCISRDAPYFGFKIPGTEKYFYVWLDAPIGYISSLAHYFGGDIVRAEKVWNDAEVQHFVGKDIIYFHLLFWPAVLHAVGWKVPENFIVHGFLTVDGEKMSKSRGTFLTASEFAEKVPETEFIRFYYAANLSHTMTDIDLNLHDFTERINNELVSNVANFIYRTLSFIEKEYKGELGLCAKDERAEELVSKVLEKERSILQKYESYEFRRVVQEILQIASLGNAYLQGSAPWKAKDEKEKKQGAIVLTTCANLVKDLSILLAPILPEFSQKIKEQLNITGDLTFSNLGFNLENRRIGTPKIIWRRMERLVIGEKNTYDGSEKKSGVVKKSGDASRDASVKKSDSVVKKSDAVAKKSGSEIGSSDLNLIVAKIIKVEKHPKADKLYIEHLDDGSGEERIIVSGLVPYYTRDELLGKQIILVNNLKPAKLRGVVSKGMLLAVQSERVTDEKGVGTIEVLEAPWAEPGDRVAIGEGAVSVEKGVAKENVASEVPNVQITIDQFFSLEFYVKEHEVFCVDRALTVEGKRLRTKTLSGKVS